MAFNIRQNPFSGGDLPAESRTPLQGELTRSPRPRPLSRLGRGHSSPYHTYSAVGTNPPSALANRHALLLS